MRFEAPTASFSSIHARYTAESGAGMAGLVLVTASILVCLLIMFAGVSSGAAT